MRQGQGDDMGKFRIWAALAALSLASPATAAPVDDAVAAVTSTMDKFNGGDIGAFFAAHREGAFIVDEFGPFVWDGPDSVQRWANDYAADAKKRGISGGRVDYGKPIQANSDGASAYVVLPTTYRFMQNGKKMAGAGSMTFLMTRDTGGWKISSWTYSGATPKAE